MTALEFGRPHLPSLQELGGRLLDSRKRGTEHESFARELLAGFFDICMRSGLDQLLADLEQEFPGVERADASTLYNHAKLVPALATYIGTLDLEGGGPRNARPGQLVDGILSTLHITIVDPPDRALVLDGKIRNEVAKAVASVVDPELAVPKIRETIIARGRELCELKYHGAYDKLVAHLDERGQRLEKLPKVPLDAVQAVQRVLLDTQNALIARVAGAAIDRAKEIIARASADAAARIDQPITLSATPREVAIRRASDPNLPKVPKVIVESLLDSLTQLAQLTWNAPERRVRTYSVKETFAVGDVLEHPKFGRGSVTAIAAQRIDVEFEDGTHTTLVHARA